LCSDDHIIGHGQKRVRLPLIIVDQAIEKDEVECFNFKFMAYGRHRSFRNGNGILQSLHSTLKPK
jgi:hypothetical protein